MKQWLRSLTAVDWFVGSIVLLLAILIGNTSLYVYRVWPVSHSRGPAVVMEVMDPSAEMFAPAWRDEIARRFDHAVGVVVHGGDLEEGRWVVGAAPWQPWQHITTAKQLVEHVREKYPDRTIVLLACNPGHLKLDMPGVYYAHSSVWCVPDRALTAEMFTENKLAMRTLDASPDEDPDDAPPPSVSAPSVVFVPVPLTRWQEKPDNAGNIFEFVTD